jgi:hypothetical protein
MSYFDDLPINIDSLIEELEGQHVLFARHGSNYAHRAKKTREAKILLDQLEAELRDSIRKELIEAGDRPTEGLLNERLNLNPKYRKMKGYVAQCQYEEDEADNAKRSMYMRKEVLLELCKFLGQEVSNTYERLAKKLDGRRR